MNSISEAGDSFPEANRMITNVLISDVFPRLLSKSLVEELCSCLCSFERKSKCPAEIDSFLNTFFTQSLPSSFKLQSAFQIDSHSALIAVFLKNRSTRLERVHYLINQLDQVFFLNEDVQRIAVRSRQQRSLIDQLIADQKSMTLEKLSNENSKFAAALYIGTKNFKFPGLSLDVLSSSTGFLTGKQQEQITSIILNDYLQVNIRVIRETWKIYCFLG